MKWRFLSISMLESVGFRRFWKVRIVGFKRMKNRFWPKLSEIVLEIYQVKLRSQFVIFSSMIWFFLPSPFFISDSCGANKINYRKIDLAWWKPYMYSFQKQKQNMIKHQNDGQKRWQQQLLNNFLGVHCTTLFVTPCIICVHLKIFEKSKSLVTCWSQAKFQQVTKIKLVFSLLIWIEYGLS